MTTKPTSGSWPGKCAARGACRESSAQDRGAHTETVLLALGVIEHWAFAILGLRAQPDFNLNSSLRPPKGRRSSMSRIEK